MTFREGDRVRLKQTGEYGRVVRLFKQWKEPWYEVRAEGRSGLIWRGPAEDFLKVQS